MFGLLKAGVPMGESICTVTCNPQSPVKMLMKELSTKAIGIMRKIAKKNSYFQPLN